MTNEMKYAIAPTHDDADGQFNSYYDTYNDARQDFTEMQDKRDIGSWTLYDVSDPNGWEIVDQYVLNEEDTE